MNMHAPQPAAGATPQREMRKLPRFKLPARLSMDGIEFEVLDWSTTGVGFRAAGADLAAGDVLEGELLFPFADRNLAAPIVAEIRHFDQKSGRGGLSYQTRSDEDLNSIAFVIEDHLAGRISVMDGLLTKNDALRAAPLPAGTAKASALSSAGTQTRRVLGLAAITAIGGFAVYFLGSSIYDRLFVFDAASAQVSFEAQDVVAPDAGTLTSVATPGPVVAGATLFTLTDAVGTTTDIPSPCTCQLVAGGPVTGAFVPAGGAVVKLVQTDASPSIEVSVAFPDLRRVYEGASVDLNFLDGTWVHDAKVVSVESLGGKPSSLATIKVDPGRPLLTAQQGEPVYARFDTAPWRR